MPGPLQSRRTRHLTPTPTLHIHAPKISRCPPSEATRPCEIATGFSAPAAGFRRSAHRRPLRPPHPGHRAQGLLLCQAATTGIKSSVGRLVDVIVLNTTLESRRLRARMASVLLLPSERFLA